MAKTIAIDGPSGAGKSTVADIVAGRINFVHADTGALFRAIAHAAIKSGMNLDDEEALSKIIPGFEISVKFEGGTQKVYLAGEDVTPYLREEETGKAASKVSAYPCSREKVLELERMIAGEYDVIMDGRDIGTCVLPDADLKIFLTATPDIRARRRYDELTAKGRECDFGIIKADIEKRDYNDSHRAIAPLKAADDAVYIDTSDMTAEEAADRIIKLYRAGESARLCRADNRSEVPGEQR